MGGNGHSLSAVLQLPFKARRWAFSVLPPSGFSLREPIPQLMRVTPRAALRSFQGGWKRGEGHDSSSHSKSQKRTSSHK